jgi:malonyl-CoA/methylmalonyl-CoA synthetase
MKTALARVGKRAILFFRDGKAETDLSYGTLNQDSNRMANHLLKLGVEKGDRVLFYLEKSLAFVVAHMAAQKMGAIGVPLNPGFKKSELAYLIENAAPQLIFTGTEQRGVIDEVAPETRKIVVDTNQPYQNLRFFRNASDSAPEVDIGPHDPGLVVYTSGTTGKPKGAILTQDNLVRDAEHVIRIWEISESDVMCHALPFFHVHGLCFGLQNPLIAGSQVFLLDRFSPQKAIEILAGKEGAPPCTLFMAVPAMYGKMMDYMAGRQMDFDHVRLWTSGSAPLLPSDFERVKKVFGKEPVEREGMTETGMNFSNPLRGVRKPGSIGIPLPELEVRIVDPVSFQDVKPGEVGEIWLRGPTVTPGYWQNPHETEMAFEAGWFRTGDLGKRDPDGYYFLTDRLKHIIISGGENISPKEVEAVLNRIEDVMESAVVGIPDEKWGEKVVAAVKVKTGSGLNPQEIRDYCREHLHDWKCPKDILLIEELPRNAMGKLLKEAVRELFGS